MKIRGLVITGCVFIAAGIAAMVYASQSGFNKYTKEDIKISDVSYDASTTTNFELNVDYDSVTFIVEDRTDVLIQNKELDGITYTITKEDATLSVKQSKGTWTDTFFQLNLPGTKRKVFSEKELIIKIPETSCFNYTITCNAGNIKIKNLHATSFNAVENAGTIELSNIQAQDAKIKLNAGELKVNTLKVDNKLEVSLNAGDASLNNISAKDLVSKINAGTVRFKEATVNNVEVKVNAGTYTFNGDVENRGTVKINAGSVIFNLKGAKENYTINGEGNGPVVIGVDKSAGSFKYSFGN